jgi:hypothetical protein
MIINSPVGRFPFEVTSMSVSNGRLYVRGQMGTWPTDVEISPADLPKLARVPAAAISVSACTVLAAGLAVLVWRGAYGRKARR